LAQVYMRQEKFDLARQALGPLAGAKDRQLQSHATILLDSIKRYEEQLARYKSQTENPAGAPRLQRRENTANTDPKEDSDRPEMSESDYLQQSLRPVESGEERFQGHLLRLDCDKGTGYFVVQAADRTYKIRATSLEKVVLRAYTPVAGQLTCGPRKNEESVVFTYRPTKDPKDSKAKIDGDAVAVELVPKDFQLKN